MNARELAVLHQDISEYVEVITAMKAQLVAAGWGDSAAEAVVVLALNSQSA